MQQFIFKAKQTLEEIYSKNESNAIVSILLEHIGISRTMRFTNPRLILDSKQANWLNSSLSKLAEYTPVQYIIGSVDFYGTKISVDKHTLIPRPETEELVDIIVKRFSSVRRLNVLDLCTGSGCIAIALAKKLHDANIEAVDLSDGALSMARKNAEQNSASVHFRKMDLLNVDISDFGSSKYDIIVSNPPYIPEEYKPLLDKNVTLYEPGMALFVPNDEPLIFYEKIAQLAPCLLSEKGMLFFETHEQYADDVAKLLNASAKLWTDVRNDIFDKKRFTISHYKC
ncbi:MAG: peptide chain release factor N(5)-glutamine methyltransferase [Bacteroidales bacterium]